MAHRPVVTNFTSSPETIQVAGVVEAKLTVRPDEAVAETVIGVVLYGLSGNGANVMVCGVVPEVMRKLWVTGAAA